MSLSLSGPSSVAVLAVAGEPEARKSGIRVGPAGPADVAELTELARRTWSEAFGSSFLPADLEAHLETHLSRDVFERSVQHDNILMARDGNRAVGFVQFGRLAFPVADASPWDQEIRRLYVDRTHQGRGIGTGLMAAALKATESDPRAATYLDVWERNDGAIRLYERLGFEVIGTRAFEVASGVPTTDDLIMVRRRTTICTNEPEKAFGINGPGFSKPESGEIETEG